MRRFIITGAPGAGKTTIIRQLELDGFGVVEEAATDVIAAAQAQGAVQPWTGRHFPAAGCGTSVLGRLSKVPPPYSDFVAGRTETRSDRPRQRLFGVNDRLCFSKSSICARG